MEEKNYYIDDTVQVGEGTFIGPGCVIKGNTVIGKNCVIEEIRDPEVGSLVRFLKETARQAKAR